MQHRGVQHRDIQQIHEKGSRMEQHNMDTRLELYGGIWGGLVPLIVLVGGLVWLSVEEMGGTKPFWACGWLAIVAGLFFAKNKHEYCRAAMRGIGDKTGIVIVTAWLFAGVFGKLMVGGGLVNGLLWLGMTTGAQGAVFTLMVFVAAALFALGTGTSTGTCIALTPVLFPAGCFLGADPALLATAILSGAAFGDNLAPISDTTIVSAYTQGATMRDVVRSRFPLAMAAATIASAIFLLFGGGGTVKPLPELQAQMDPSGALMLLALATVVISALMGRHIIESLIYGNIAAAVVGVFNGNLLIGDIFSIPAKRGISTGLIQDGISGVVGAIIFALLILAVTQILVESGIMKRILSFAEKFIINTVRQAELSIIGGNGAGIHSHFRQRSRRIAGGAQSGAPHRRKIQSGAGPSCKPDGLRRVHHLLHSSLAHCRGGLVCGCGFRRGIFRPCRSVHFRRAVQPVFMGIVRSAALFGHHRLEPQIRRTRQCTD